MYSIKNLTNNTETYSDTIVEIFLHPNGSYVQANAIHPAQGFCALVPVEYEQPVYPENEDGMPDYEAEPIGTETVKTMRNQVYYYDRPMKQDGEEFKGEYAEIPAVPVITELEDDLEQAYELLYG